MSTSLPRQLSKVFLRPSPVGVSNGTTAGLPSAPPSFTFASNGGNLLVDESLHSRVLAALTSIPSDSLSRRDMVAYQYYAEAFETLLAYPSRWDGTGVVLLSHLAPILELVNGFLMERGSKVFWEPARIEGRDCFVARAPRSTERTQELVDVAVLELHMTATHPGSPRSIVPFASHSYATPLAAIWTPTSLIFGTFVTSHGDRIFRVASLGKEKPLVIPPLSAVGRLNQVGAICGLARVGEAMEKSGALKFNGVASPGSSRGPAISSPLERFTFDRRSYESIHNSPPERYRPTGTRSPSPRPASHHSPTSPYTTPSTNSNSSGQYSDGRSPWSPMSPMFAAARSPPSTPPLPMFPPLRPLTPAPARPPSRGTISRVASPDPYRFAGRPPSPRQPARHDTNDTVIAGGGAGSGRPAPETPRPNSSTTTSNSLQNLLSELFVRALNDPSVATRVGDLTQTILSTPSSVSPVSYDTNHLASPSTRRIVFAALQTALANSHSEEDHPGLYKILKGLLKLGMLDEIHMNDVLSALWSSENGRDKSGNGYRRDDTN